MAKKFKFTIFSLLFAALVIAPVSNVQGRQKATEEELSALLKEKSVLVEAYLVQVDNEALYEAGVAVVPQKSAESVTVLKLLRCLAEPENGRVISSARVALKKDQEAETSSEKVRYIPRKKMIKTGKEPVESVQFSPYSTRVRLEVLLIDMNDDKIRIRYSYKYDGLSDLPDTQTPQESPPGNISFTTQSSLTLPLNKPIILSSSEEAGTSMFFILRAQIVK